MGSITRDFISDNFFAVDLQNNGNTFTKNDLVEKINYWKYILKFKFEAKPKESILIGIQRLNIDYLGLIYAASELSLAIVIVDYIRADHFKNLDFDDPKTRALSPIDIFIHDLPKEYFEIYPDDFAKFNFFTKCSKRAYSIIEDIDDEINEEDFNSVIDIRPNSEDVLIKATTSGTTSAPKVIEHTQGFIYAMAKRNMYMFKGSVAHLKNLNHGASAAVTLFPVLASSKVKKNLIYAIDEDAPMYDFIDKLYPYKDELEFMSFPYPYLTDRFIVTSREKNITWPNLNLVSLTYALDSAKIAVRDGIFKTAYSIFGSNETIGPIFENIFDKNCWDRDSRFYRKIDDFYKIKIYDDGKMGVYMPVYEKEIIPGDHFREENGYYIHLGRVDMVRINGEDINLSVINELNKDEDRMYIVIDTLNHCLYIAVWDDIDDNEIQKFKDKVESNFQKVKVTKITHLDKKNFYYGIKLDNELLREYFRQHID